MKLYHTFHLAQDRSQYKLRVFENRALRRIFELERQEVTELWRNLHNELHSLYFSPVIVREIKFRKGSGWGV
jgi:hypothetical protein